MTVETFPPPYDCANSWAVCDSPENRAIESLKQP